MCKCFYSFWFLWIIRSFCSQVAEEGRNKYSYQSIGEYVLFLLSLVQGCKRAKNLLCHCWKASRREGHVSDFLQTESAAASISMLFTMTLIFIQQYLSGCTEVQSWYCIPKYSCSEAHWQKLLEFSGTSIHWKLLNANTKSLNRKLLDTKRPF